MIVEILDYQESQKEKIRNALSDGDGDIFGMIDKLAGDKLI